VRLDVVRRLKPPASPTGFLLRTSWKFGLGVGILAVLLTAGGVDRVQPNGHALATNVLPTTVPCGPIAEDSLNSHTAHWSATRSPYGTGSPYNLPVNTANNTDPMVTPCDAIIVPADFTLTIDASQGPVQIFSHGAAINVDRGHLLVLGTSEVNSVLFDAEPDVASWTGITINGNSANLGNASFAFASIQHALRSITITSGATSTPDPTPPDPTKQPPPPPLPPLPYGLALVNSGIGPSYFDGIDATDTPVSVKGQAVGSPNPRADGKFGTVNNIGSEGINFNWGPSAPVLPPNGLALKVDSVAFGSSVPFAETGCLPLQLPCSAGSIGNDAIVASFTSPNPPPVYIFQSRFYRAGSFGIWLNSPNRPIIADNNFDCNGTGSPKPKETCIGTGLKYSAVYLNKATVDLENSVTNNVGHEDGLDAIVVNGSIVFPSGLSQPKLTWKNATNDPTSETHQLGYLLDGDLSFNSGTLVVPGGSVIKSKGSINLTGAALDASDTTKPGTKIFTSLRDNVNIPSCPSVFVQSCLSVLPAGEWGGINLTGSATDTTIRSATTGTITNAAILYATTGIHVLYGSSLTVTASAIGPTFADSVLAQGTPLMVSGTTFGCPVGVCSGPSSGNHGILADFSNSGPPTTGLKIGGPNPTDKNTFQGSVNEAIRAVGLAGQPVDIENNAIQNAGATGSAGSAGIYLQGADKLTLKGNDLVGSGTGNLRYPAIWLDGISKADFGGPISGNTGTGNGLNAIAFHGDSKALTWQTVAASGQLGYIVDGNLLVAGDLTLPNNSYAPVLAGTITVQGGKLTSTGALVTSLKEQTQLLASCGSVFVPKASGVCPAPTAADWGGLVLDPGKSNQLTNSTVRYAVTGIAMSTGSALNLTLSNTSITNTAGDGLSTSAPVTITGGSFTSNGAHGIKIDLSGVGPSTIQSLVSQCTITASGQEGILAVGLAGQTLKIDKTTVDHAGAYGINLKDPGKDAGLYPGIYKQFPGSLTLTSNTVTNTAATFPAIYLNGFFGPFGNVSGNKGAANGVNAIAFHGTVTDDLDWKTAVQTSDPTTPLGYVLDSTLTMTPPPPDLPIPTVPPQPPPPPPPAPPGTVTTQTLTVRAGDVVKVGNSGVLKLQNVKFLADDTGTSSQKVFTSLTDDTAGVPTCHSVLVSACPAVVKPGDWGGIILTDGTAKGALVNASVRYASTGILITSGASSTSGSSVFGLVVSASSIGPSAVDGINAVKTAISVTTSSISGGTHGISVDFSGAVPGTPLRLSGNRFVSTSAEAILGQALGGQPAWITDNRIQGAGTYGIRLLNADQLVLRNNNVAGSGGGPNAGAGRYPAIYLPAVSADFIGNVRGNVGSGNGLDALVFDGKATGDLTWVTPSNTASTHALGYLLDGGLTLQGGKLVVGSGDVVKSLGGPITINGGNITATGLAGGSPTSNSAIFTSLKDNPGAPGAPPILTTADASDAAAVSCPSVLVSDCNPHPGDWGGLAITSNAAGLKGTGAITYGLINYANTGISLDSGPIPANPELVPSNFRLSVVSTTIANASKDGINSLDTPFSVTDSSTIPNVVKDPTTIQNVGANGIVASFFSPANCTSTIPTVGACVRLNVTNSQITGTGKDGIIANGLSGQPTVISNNTITDAGAYGIRLVGADQLTLTTNHVRKSALPPLTALRYPAIYLSSVKADFETSGTGAIIQGNTGKWTGLDAIVFHGEATKKLTWITAVAASSTDVTFGYLLDGPLVVDGDLVTTDGDIVKIMNGGININGGSLQSVGTTFTSLKDNPGLPACHSVFIPDACPTLPATLAAATDWNGINIGAADSTFTSSKVLYATAGLSITNAKLDVSRATFYRLAGTALSSSGPNPLTVTCSSIRGNGTGVAADTGSVSQSDVYNNSVNDLVGNSNLHANYDWLGGAAAKISGPVAVNGALTVQRPSATLTLTSDNPLAAPDLSGDPAFGIGNVTLAAATNRQMNTSVVPFAQGFTLTTTGLTNNGWTTDHNWSPNPFVLDLAHFTAGVKTLTLQGGRDCVPPEVDDAVANLNNPDSNLMTPASKTFSASILPTMLVPSPANGAYGGKATLTAHLTSNGVDLANQTVTFKLNGSATGTATTDGTGIATLLANLSTINAGSYPAGVQASYAGDPDHFFTPAPAALGSPLTATLTVTQAPTTTAQAATTASTTAYGQAITLSAKVMTTVAGGIDPGGSDGTVAFTEGATTFCSAALGTGSTSNEAACTTKTVAVGAHNITAVYIATPGGNFQNSSAASTLSQTVSTASTTTSTAGSDQNPSTYGQLITLSATVTSADLNPGSGDGMVAFKEGPNTICSAGLGTGGGTNVAACTVSTLVAATHTISAVYTASGGNYQDSSAAATLSQVVNPAATTTATASSDQNPSANGQMITLSTTVTSTFANPGIGAGTVAFMEGVTTLCSAALGTGGASNQASCTISTLTVGSHIITAVYTAAGGNYQNSTAAATLTQTVNP
jgi:hypothetical protein